MSRKGASPRSLIKLNHFAPHEVWISLSFLSVSGTVKEDFVSFFLEKLTNEKLETITTFVEYSSGESAIALALRARQLKKRCVVVMPYNVSYSIVEVLLNLGSEVIICDAMEDADSERSSVKLAQRIADHIPNSLFFNLYSNQLNPISHYELTSRDFSELRFEPDTFICPVESGGLISGCAKCLEENYPHIKTIGVESEGSVLSTMGISKATILPIPGIGHTTVPKTLDYSFVNDWITLEKSEIFIAHNEMMSVLGILAGYSSSAALLGVKKYLQWQNSKKRVIVALPDSFRGNQLLSFQDVHRPSKYPFVFSKSGITSLSKHFS